MSMEIEELSSSAKFTCKIKNFSKLNAHEGVYSDVFSVGRFKWKLHIFPKGNGRVYDHLSLFLDAVERTEFPYLECRFTITSQTNRSKPVSYEFKRQLTEAGNMGYPKFMPLSDLYDPAKGYIVNDTCVIQINVLCRMNEEPVEIVA